MSSSTHTTGDWKPRPWLAALLNLWGGLGHLYAGRLPGAILIPPLLLVWLLGLLVGVCYAPTRLARLGIMVALVVTRLVGLPLWGYIAARRTAAAPKRGFQRWYALVAYFIVITGIVVFLQRVVGPPFVSWYTVTSGSMQPTLLVNDWLMTAFDGTDLQRGDVVLAPGRESGQLFFRRVIGLPGDRVELRNFHAYINGQPEEPPLGACGRSPLEEWGAYGPVVVPAGQYALFGDCRDNAMDVRFLGFTPRADIVKRRMWILWSADDRGVRLDRIGQTVR